MVSRVVGEPTQVSIGAMTQMAAVFFGLPEEHRQFLEQVLGDDSCWLLSALLEGVRVIRIPSMRTGQRWLLARAAPGSRFCSVGYGRAEMLVLSGSYREGDRLVKSGHVALLDDASPGPERTVSGEHDCIVAIRRDPDCHLPKRLDT